MAKISKKKRKSSKTKTISKKKTRAKKTKSLTEKRSEKKIDHAIIDNFITLQKIMVNFSIKFDALTIQISQLLELFEISAKSLARKDFETDKEDKDIKKVLEKLDDLSQQSGLIGKGLALIHETNYGKKPSVRPPQQRQHIPERAQGKFNPKTPIYRKSPASKIKEI